MVAGLTNGELIAPMTYEEMMTSDFFEAWFQKFLLPTLNTPSVIIMDNARFHRMGKLELLCKEFGHKLLPLPPYSPEYNPIEKTWAHIKKHLKKVLPSCNTFYKALLSCSCFNWLYITDTVGKEAIKHLESPFGMNMSNITIDGQEMDLSQTMPSYAQVVNLYEDTSISVSNNETDKVLAGSLYTDTNEQGLTIPSSLLKNWNEQTGKNLTANDLIGKSVSASIIESAAEIRSILCFLNREFLIL
ncbi:IS630-Spn1, transposase Orf2 [Streptococcus pneumoniae]|nr:IS630-Spn1, transposase Orf2 [Streptococcus pneumoniae]VPX36376.1 IS630-Spn1, transposase Orf2 [Streptococcus pneumoniae]